MRRSWNCKPLHDTYHSSVQSQTAVTAYFSSEKVLPFCHKQRVGSTLNHLNLMDEIDKSFPPRSDWLLVSVVWRKNSSDEPSSPSKHEDTTLCCCIIGPPPTALVQYCNNIESSRGVCWPGCLSFFLCFIFFSVCIMCDNRDVLV